MSPIRQHILRIKVSKESLLSWVVGARIAAGDAWEIDLWIVHVVAQVVSGEASGSYFAIHFSFCDRKHRKSWPEPAQDWSPRTQRHYRKNARLGRRNTRQNQNWKN